MIARCKTGCKILHRAGKKRRECVIGMYLCGEITLSSGMMEI